MQTSPAAANDQTSAAKRPRPGARGSKSGTRGPKSGARGPKSGTRAPRSGARAPKAGPEKPTDAEDQGTSRSIPEAPEDPVPPPDEDANLAVVLCPPDGGSWSRFTCALAFAAAFICDGLCLSLFLFDDRVGIVDLPYRTRTLEHVAVICLSRYLIGTTKPRSGTDTRFIPRR